MNKLYLRTIHDFLFPLCPKTAMLWLEERYLLSRGEPELRLCEALCDPERDAVDIGANEGTWTLILRKYARSVIAFEPIPWMAKLLNEKFGDTIVINELALSRSRGSRNISIPLIGGRRMAALARDRAGWNHPVRESLAQTKLDPTPSGDRRTEKGLASLSDHVCDEYDSVLDLSVNTARLDDFEFDNLGFLKIDVEGHEEAVLSGGISTIERHRPNVLVEVEERHSPGAFDRINRFFHDLRFEGYFVLRDQIWPLSHFWADVLQRPQNIGKHETYINNFIFLPVEMASRTCPRLQRLMSKGYIQ